MAYWTEKFSVSVILVLLLHHWFCSFGFAFRYGL